MHRMTTARRPTARWAAGLALWALTWGVGADGAPAADAAPAGEATAHPAVAAAMRQAETFARTARDWYHRTPPADRVTWGGLAAAAVLGLGVMFERMARVRRRRVLPAVFADRFLDRLREGKLDRGKSLDLCELHPCAASRVALAAVKRWGRPVADLERAVSLAVRVESDRLRRNVGTLRRIAALAPLVGLLGTLMAAGRALSVPDVAWAPAVGAALGPFTAGVALAILSLIAYDGLVGRVETLAGELDRLGAETIDAVAIAAPAIAPRPAADPRRDPGGPIPTRPPHPIRVEIPEPMARPLPRRDRLRDRDDDGIELD